MFLLSLLVSAFWPAALVVVIVSILAHRFVWQTVSVYAAIVGGCAYFVVALFVGGGFLPVLAYAVGLVACFYYYQKKTGTRLW